MFLSPLAKIRNLLLNKDESEKNFDKSSVSLEKFLNEKKLLHLKEEELKIKLKKKNKRGFILYEHELSPERQIKIRQMRNYQIFIKNKQLHLFPLINGRIIGKEIIGNNNNNDINDSCDNDEISRIFINDKEQLIKNYILPKIVRSETVSYDIRKSIKVSNGGKVKLQDFYIDTLVPNHPPSELKYDNSITIIHDKFSLDSSVIVKFV